MRSVATAEGSHPEESQWLAVSDMMAGLMIIFMFILIAYIRPIVEGREQVRDIAVAWNETETQISEALRREFADDLERWDAEFDGETLTVRFKAPEVLFAQASAEIRPAFKAILDDFFPRYIRILRAHEASIEEVRIEGHTSSEWKAGAAPEEAYFGNMALSQDRTRAVLAYGLTTLNDPALAAWAQARATANGMSSSRIIKDSGGLEDKDRSRRVEFRVLTDAKRQIVRIVDSLGSAEERQP